MWRRVMLRETLHDDEKITRERLRANCSRVVILIKKLEKGKEAAGSCQMSGSAAVGP